MEGRKVIRRNAGWVVFILFAAVFGWLIANQMILGFGIVGGSIGLFFAFLCFANAEWAIYFLTAYAFFNSGLATAVAGDHFQAGVPLDGLLVIALAGILVGKQRALEAGRGFFQSPIVLMWLILFGYILAQIANPHMNNPIGWFNQVRKSAEELLLLFICYCAFDTPQRIKNFIKVFFVLSVMVGFYGCIQQWHGLFPFEYAWVTADSNRFSLLFIGGEFRKWSTMADPTAFGIIMAAVSACYLIIAIYQRDRRKRWWIVFGCLFMMLGMFYSGTRTANVVLLGGFSMYLLLQADKRSTWIFGLSMAAVLLIALNLPIYSNYTLNRFRSSFQGAKDASYNVRELSRKFIQPYAHQHPFGGGLGTSNTFGKDMNPGHYLAGFQTDDGYLKYALEIGWIGMGMICIWHFIVLRTGIKGYFRSRDPEARYLYIAMLACILPFIVALIAQDVMGQMSNDAVIFPMVAVLMRLNVFDKKPQPSS
jgi:hypothetical protein